jgi:PAS domain S-box-containing protein
MARADNLLAPLQAALPKPDDRPALPRRLLIETFAGMLSVFALFECAMQFLFPDHTIWQSHATAVVLGSVLATGITGMTVVRWCRRCRAPASSGDEGECESTRQALRACERRYHHVVEGATDILYSHDAAGNLLEWGGAGQRILGYTLEEVTRMNIAQIVVPEHLEMARRKTAHKIAEDVQTAYELDVVSKDGRRLTMEICSQARYENGQPVRVTGIARDVTERNKTREMLRRQGALLHNIISNIPYSVFWKDRHGLYLGCNDILARDLGMRSADEVVEKTDFDMPCSKNEAAFYVRCDQQVMTSGQPMLNIEETQLRPDGSRAVLLTSKVAMRAADGEIIGVLGIYADITERKKAEEALREAEARYRLLFDANPQPMWVFDAETRRILAVNDAAVSHYGYSRTEFLSMTMDDIQHADQAQCSGVRKHRKKDGTATDVEVSSHGLVFDYRNAFIVLAHDVTERRRLEEQLRQAQKMEAVGQLAGGVAHDFNNLLTVIIGYTEMLLSQVDVRQPSYELLQQIQRAGERAASLTRQLLAYGRRQILRPAVLDLNAVVNESATLLRRLIGEDVELVLDLEPHLKPVRIDPGQMGQILMNMAANSRDAMARGGRLTIKTSGVHIGDMDLSGSDVVPGKYVLMSVSDNGGGMNRETLARVFEPFFTTKDVGKGTGFALSKTHFSLTAARV